MAVYEIFRTTDSVVNRVILVTIYLSN